MLGVQSGGGVGDHWCTRRAKGASFLEKGTVYAKAYLVKSPSGCSDAGVVVGACCGGQGMGGGDITLRAYAHTATV